MTAAATATSAPTGIRVERHRQCQHYATPKGELREPHAPSIAPRYLCVSSRRMTWSIIARDASGAFGVAIATRFFAVGALCPHAESGVGALSTQALVNPHYGPRCLELLRAGVPAPDVVKRVTAPDDGRDHRQLHVIDAAGRIGQYTGVQCIE